MEEKVKPMKIAVVGGGVAGLSSAWLLSQHHDVTIIEARSRLGGHTNTRMVVDGHKKIPVDTGFIVCNPVNYPNFYRLLDQWGVARRDSDMSFGFSSAGSEFGWVGPSWRQFIRMPENLLRPSCWQMLMDWRKFNGAGIALVLEAKASHETLGDFLKRIGVGRVFTDQCLIPLAASVWSSPDESMLEFPAMSFLQFFYNHGLLKVSNFPQWQTIVGGSKVYVQAFQSKFSGTIRLNEGIGQVERSGGGATIVFVDGHTETFDHVVFATHADTAQNLLKDPSQEERAALGAFEYHRSSTILHTDESVMPRNRRNWASWNYRRPAGATIQDPVPITYHMNRLQGIQSTRDYFVTLNSRSGIDVDQVLYETTYAHPCFTPATMRAQQAIDQLDGALNTHYCGSYMRYGFHEDAVLSACRVARRLGVVW